MLDKKQLSDEQLDKVSGGCAGLEGIDTNGQFSGFLNMYQLQDTQRFGQQFYFIYKEKTGIYWFKAKLVNSYEAWNWFGTTVSTHELEVTESGNSGNSVGRKFKPTASSLAAYTTKNY